MTTTPPFVDRPCFHAYQPLSAAQIEDPFPVLAQARRTQPVFFSEEQNSYVVTSYRDLNEILANPTAFSSAGILRPTKPPPPEVKAILAEGYDPDKLGAMIMLDPPVHTRIRKITSNGFTPRRIAGYEQVIRQITTELIDEMLAAGGPLDFVKAFAYRLPLTMILDMLALPRADGPQLHQWANDKMALQFGDLDTDAHVRAARGVLAFQRYIGAIVAERRQRPGDDLISVIATAEDEGEQLDLAMVVGQVMGLVNAGHETVTSLLSTAMLHLLEDRSRWEALCAQPERAERTVEEALRFDPPLKQVSRIALRDITVGGVPIPAGSRVVVALYSANRDEAAFQCPESFDPGVERRSAHLAFSRGIHHCLGAPLARLQGRIALEQLARRIPSLRLPAGFKPEFLRNVTVRKPLALPVEWA